MTIIVPSDREMYRWRSLTPEQREQVLAHRKQNRQPWHSPPHYESETHTYLLTAACYEHVPVVGKSPERMKTFETNLLDELQTAQTVHVWIILPNHYHVLIGTPRVKHVLKRIGRLHGRTSYQWNVQDDRPGRKVWFNCVETAMKSERHFWATVNYVLHNAVYHGYVERWRDWPYSNAADYLQLTGRDEAWRRWREYPVLDYGKDWDPADL